MPCADGYISNHERTGCIKVDENFLKWESPLSIVLLVSCFLGLVLVLFIIAVFRKYSTTPVVKASNRDVSLVHLTSHALVFLLPLLYVGRPTVPACIIRLNVFPVLFTFITAIIFLKTDRIVRIFNSKSRLTKRSRLLSNKVQYLLTMILTVIPVLGTAIYLIQRPITVTKEMDDEKYTIYCQNEEACQLVQLTYILLLALLCTFEAFHARKLPESFNEGKFICFSMFAFVLMWVGYVPVCIDVTGSAKQFMTCVFIILINFLTVTPIYLPKIHIILLRPEDNRHEQFRKTTLHSAVKEARRMSPVSTPTATHEPKRSVNANEDDINDNVGSNISPESQTVGTLSSLTDVVYGSNDQLVAQHLGIPQTRRPSTHVPEFENMILSNSMTSV